MSQKAVGFIPILIMILTGISDLSRSTKLYMLGKEIFVHSVVHYCAASIIVVFTLSVHATRTRYGRFVVNY